MVTSCTAGCQPVASAASAAACHDAEPKAAGSLPSLPGFRMSCGSRARLMAAIIRSGPGPCSASRCSSFPYPTPCSPVSRLTHVKQVMPPLLHSEQVH